MSLLKEEMNSWKEKIEKALDDIMPIQEDFPPVIFEAMRYSLLMGGKRLRPMIMLWSCKALNGNIEKCMPFACAMEMIHTYSLIHDDLPAMDNDDFRRNKPTNHKVFGEDMGILAGDGLLSFASELMSQVCLENLDKESIYAMKTILNGAGVNGMLVGQVADVFYEGQPIGKEILDYIHVNKTAKMISASFKAGVIIGGGNEEIQRNYEKAGEKIGVAFQILDDILDVTSTNEVLGKPIGSDEKNNKTTYVTLFGVKKSKEIARKLSNEAIELLKNTNTNCELLIELSNYLTKRLY